MHDWAGWRQWWSPKTSPWNVPGRLGDQHEHRVLASYQEEFGESVVVIPDTRSSDVDGLARAVGLTRAALDSDAAVIFQAAFATDEFVGFADFLVRGADNRWIVQDTKLARHARVTALMQLAAYVDQLDQLGVPRSGHVELLLGDGTTSTHQTRDILPVFELRRARLRALIADRDLAAGADGAPIAWGDDRGALRIMACGRCATCDAEVVQHRDLLLVAGMRPVQRERLRAEAIDTIDDLASANRPPARMSADTFASLRTQARLQLESPAGGTTAEPSVETTDAPPAPAAPTYEVFFPTALGALPRPDHGDLFFDFEGDPLYIEGASTDLGIDYLFGWVDTREQYTPLWAHTFADEKRALETFLDFVNLRRTHHPAMHIYHYAPYETTHLQAMAAKYGVREADVDRLLRDGVFVDLYPIVRRALRVGSRSYSIKKLEPLYMGDEVRTSDVQKGDDSIVRYVEAREFEEAGTRRPLARSSTTSPTTTAMTASRRCASAIGSSSGRASPTCARPSTRPRPSGCTSHPRAPRRWGALPTHETEERAAEALRLAAAAIDYYPREAKTFWATHFLRLQEPVSVWEETRDVVVVDADRSRILTDWHMPEGARTERRIVELRGELAPGTRLTTGSSPFALYDNPPPFPAESHPRWIHAARTIRVVDLIDDGVIVEENAIQGFTWSVLPIALTPPSPPMAGSQQGAIDEWADAVIQAAPTFPTDPATDLLLRRPPRTGSGRLARGSGDRVADIVQTIADLDHSYLAIQGPPGTGKTYVGSHVVARLVAERGFRVGIVAQSHAVVENMLDRIVDAGLAKEHVAKATKGAPTGSESFTVIPKNGVAAFTGEQAGGYVVGGTAWDLAHAGRIPRGSLDLLVVDEAGQFSLASTIAVSVAASRLLLLGDPQQLPQVSQGTHPEPVDTSALGWVMDGAAVIAEDRGYFLAETRRMRPEVAEPVSQLAYEGKLEAHECTSGRVLADTQPGLIPVPLTHTGNATQSAEEAEVVVTLVRDLVGRAWSADADVHPRPLLASDIIVVTPYNAQQVLVEEALTAAGFSETPVGTVDKFQGQEAAVAIVTLAASSGRDAPRGLEFLLLQNRLNVAVSRAQHTAYVVYSTGLLDDLPRTPDGVTRLSAFARLIGAA